MKTSRKIYSTTLVCIFCILPCWPDVHSQTSVAWPTFDGKPPKLLGHGGEKFYLPEHTTGSYELAAITGADYVEPDVVLSKDGILVCFHDIALKQITDVESHPQFLHLRGNYTIIVDGEEENLINDYLVVNFTLAELKTLTLKQRQKGVRLQYFNGLFPIPTFQEFIDSVHKISSELGKPIGIIPEIKQPLFHNTIFNKTENFIESELLRMLRANGYPILAEDVPQCKYQSEPIQCGPVIIQSFDKDSLKYVSNKVNRSSIEIMLLIYPDVYRLTPSGFQEIAAFSNYVCLWKEYMYLEVEAEIKFKGWNYDQDVVSTMGGFIKPQDFIPTAHALGMKVGLFTIHDSRESSDRGCAIKCENVTKEEEMFYFFRQGVDAMFIENIPESISIRMKFDYELKLASVNQVKV